MTSSFLVNKIFKNKILSRHLSAVNLISAISSLKIFLKTDRLFYTEFQTITQSSRYLLQCLVIYISVLSFYYLFISIYIFSYRYPNVRLAYVGAILVPIAVLFICLKKIPFNVNVF